MALIKWEEILAIKIREEDENDATKVKTYLICLACAPGTEINKNVDIRDDVITKDDIESKKGLYFCDQCGFEIKN